MGNKKNIGSKIRGRRRTIFKITTPVLSIMLLSVALMSNMIKIDMTSAGYNYDVGAIQSEISVKAKDRVFVPMSEISAVMKNQIRSYCQYLIDQSRFDGQVSLCEELYQPYILRMNGACYIPFWTIKDGHLVEFYTNINSNMNLIEDCDTFVQLSWLNMLARISHVGKVWQYSTYPDYTVELRNQYLENYYWAKNRASADLNFGHAWTCWELSSRLVEILNTGDFCGLLGFGGLTSSGVAGVATYLRTLSNMKMLVDTADVAVGSASMGVGEKEFYQQWNTKVSSRFSEISDQLNSDITVDFGADASELYLAWLIYRDLGAAYGQEWITSALAQDLETPGFLSQKVIDAHDVLDKTSIASTVVSTLLGSVTVKNTEQAKTCYVDSIDMGQVAALDWKLANEYLPKIMSGMITPDELVDYYQTVDLRSMILSGYYQRNAQAAYDGTWGTTFFNIQYPKLTGIFNPILKIFTGNSVEQAITNLNDMSNSELDNAISYSLLLCPSNQYEMYQQYYRSGTAPGVIQVNPTTFYVVLTSGEKKDQLFTISVTGNTVQGIEMKKTKGPEWVTLDHTQIGILSVGSTDHFVLSASPSQTTSPGVYPVELTITCVSGKPSQMVLSGDITVQPKIGSVSISPSSWFPSLAQGNSLQQVFCITAQDNLVKNVNVIKKDTLSWVTLSQTTVGDITAGGTKQFTLTASPSFQVPCGTYSLMVDITYTTDTVHTLHITGTITILTYNGLYTVSPLTWNPTVNSGSSISCTFTVSANGGQVRGVWVISDNMPMWSSITPNSLGDFSIGDKKTFTVTISPSANQQSKTYPLSFKVNCISGIPSFIMVQGTITVIPTLGDDQYEDNDDYDHAKEVTTGSYPGLRSFDEDDYKLTLQTGDSITATIAFNNQENDLNLYLECPHKLGVVASSDSNNQNSETVRASITQSDDYYLAVRSARGTYTGSKYDLSVTIARSGSVTVDPTTWNPLLTPGDLLEKTFTVTAKNGVVNGVTVSKTTGPSWMSVTPSNLGNLPAGQSAQFMVTAAPTMSVSSGEYPFTLTIACTSGSPAETKVQGVMTIEDQTPGTLSISPSDWQPTIVSGTTMQNTFTITANNQPLHEITITKTNGPDWLTFSPSHIDSLRTGQQTPCQITLAPSEGVTPGTYDCTLMVASASTAQTTLSIIVTVTVQNNNNDEFSEDFEYGAEGWVETTGNFQYAGTQTQIHHQGSFAFEMISTRESNSGYAGQYLHAVNIPIIPGKQFTFSYYFPSKNVSYVGFNLTFNNGKQAYYFSLFNGWFVNNTYYYLQQYKNEQPNIWHTHTVNLYDDYLAAYGTVPSDLQLTSISIAMGDPYFTNQPQTAFFDTISIT